jgi:hypothetical protein
MTSEEEEKNCYVDGPVIALLMPQYIYLLLGVRTGSGPTQAIIQWKWDRGGVVLLY